MSYIALTSPPRWALLSDKTTQLDGRRVHLIYEDCLPVLFRTRREARKYAEKRFGYIKSRPDLRREPHCCRMPKAVRVRASVESDPLGKRTRRAA